MHDERTDQRDVSQAALWVGVLGGALAWLVHFLLAYAISEWGCVPPVTDVRAFGMTGTALLLLAVSAVTFAAACAATAVAQRSRHRLHDHGDAPDAAPHAGPFMARLGLQLSGLFAFIILVESIPIFYFLSGC